MSDRPRLVLVLGDFRKHRKSLKVALKEKMRAERLTPMFFEFEQLGNCELETLQILDSTVKSRPFE